MTGAVGYALAAMVCYGLGDFVFKRAARAGVTAHHFLMVQAWCFCPMIVALCVADRERCHARLPALWGGLAGLFIFLGFYNFLRSLVTGPVSINAPIFRLNFVVTVVLAAIVLREPLTAGRLAGIAAAVAAVWLLLGGTGRDRGALPGRSLQQVLVASGTFGIANFCHKLGLVAGAPPEALLAAQALVFVTLATLFAYSVEGNVRPPAATWAHAVPAALLLIAAFLFFLHALVAGDATVLVPIAQMGFVPAAILGIMAFGEPPSTRIVVGLAIAVAALGLLAMS